MAKEFTYDDPIDNNPYVYVRNTGVDFSQKNLYATIKCLATGRNGCKKIHIKLELQKKTGSSYATVKTWEEDFSGPTAQMTRHRLLAPKSQYRAKGTFTFSSGKKKETIVKYDS